MAIDLRKNSHVLFFVVFLPGLSWGLGWLAAQLIPEAPFWLETLSPLAAYGLLYGYFDKTAWRWPLFRWLGIVTVPNLRGRWLGEQTSSFRDKNGKNRRSRVILEVTQTFSNIAAQTYYQNWHSRLTAATFIAIDDVPHFVMMFESAPKVTHADGVLHRGVVKLNQVSDGRLEGDYFNGNGSHGELTFRRTQTKLYQTFESVGGKTK